MWELSDIQAEYRRLDAILGIDTSKIRISFSGRMVRQYGVCVFNRNTPTEIRIASFLRSEDAVFWNTVRHEYAHAAAALLSGKRHGHDELWKAVCLRIGANPKRLSASCEAAEKRAERHKQYIVTCCRCDAKSVYLRKGAVVQAILEGKSCTCKKCGSKEFTVREE